MAGLCWMAVTLGLLLSVGKSVDTFERPTNGQLRDIVNDLWNRYRPSYEVKKDGKDSRRYPMFSLAVSIPYNNNKKMYDVSQVIDSADDVKNLILRCEVYRGTRVVAATVLRWPNVLDQCPNERVKWPDVLKTCGRSSMTWAEVKRDCPHAVHDGKADHAENRTLQNFDTLTNNRNQNDFLLFYVLASPCGERCTNQGNPRNILNGINEIKRWNNYAVVFSDVFQPRSGEPVPEENLIRALEQLGTYDGPLGPIGLKYIFRCDGSRCSSCSMGDTGTVTRFCYTDKPKPGPSHNLPSSSFILPQRGRSDSPSRSGQGGRDQKNNNINKNAGVSTNVGGNSGGVVGQGNSGGGQWRQGRGKKGK
ncbi:uncharacterized protein [Cebidichthys violaceus]|uniref:uncharacterized protein n=1 Tax=Cebidichthys violaceus TaxID=271503 RepID=UPI0035CB85EA